MKQLIYYPSFEVQNIDWLKFALLYIGELKPIIPDSATDNIGEDFKEIMKCSDLIIRQVPSYEAGFSASLDAIDVIQPLLDKPEKYREIISRSNFQRWRERKNQNCLLYKEKYSQTWIDFCLEYKIGFEANEGLFVSKDIVNIYMSILAHVLGEHYDISAITDDKDCDRNSIILRRFVSGDNITNEHVRVGQRIVNLLLPQEIHEIPLQKFIELRNKDGFKKKLSAFHEHIEYTLSRSGDDFKENDFLKSLDHVNRELIGDILTLSMRTILTGLSIWIAIKDPTPLSIMKAAGDTGITFGGYININNKWKHTESKRFCKKYLSDIRGIGKK